VTTGNGFNAAIGVSTLQDLTSGTENMAVGLNTLNDITTGRRNTAIGSQAGSGGYLGS